ncbi:putative exported protein [Taylorella asinigenitalis 14/45]|uniref:Copper-binding protein n=2 Tax=Taylorella asinigenitalis TaxID=84590 RepID=G4QDH7_TAYAM|nr:copper-binding protein [Taylorella asinigenitalis]AEP35994.1 hypothetical protein TASI_0203 [Taylorella asinigenitalis MCE3]CCG20201.1 putative exported protein [Taylorella asinigenitalis 14/45]
MKKALLGLLLAAGSTVAFGQAVGSGKGEVRRIDTAKSTIAIKHGEIADLGLPAVTLVYDIPANLLSGIKPGDKVSFTAKHENKKYIITEIKK